MCVDLNIPTVEIEFDAKLVVDLLKKVDRNLNGNDVIVANCKEELRKVLRFIIKHFFRKANQYVDAFARREALLFQDLLVNENSFSTQKKKTSA